ncbi:hypothetical protein [Flavobacterium sp.]|jgi:hypothetical protein|uniref:hypothetical protein n=1 Tax=Flavobacterium sp. TaxID=239 RepID=UPI0037BECA21
MTVRKYLDSLAKEELIELLKKLEVNDIIISGAFASTENAIRGMIEKDFSKQVGEIIEKNRQRKLNDLGI